MLIKATIEEVRAVIAAVNDIRRALRERNERRAHALTGTWTNEGDVVGPIPSHYMDLELLIDGHKASGIVSARATRGRTSLPSGSIVGRMRWGKVTAEVVDVRRGRLVKFGDISLRLKNEQLLWTARNLHSDFLPRSATLWKLDVEDEDD